MGLAIIVPTRLWVTGVVSQTRDRKLADQLVQQVRRVSKTLCDLLICTDGWSPYPNSIKRAFREKIERMGKRGQCSLDVWSGLQIGTVMKHTVNKHLKEVIRQMTHGNLEQAI